MNVPTCAFTVPYTVKNIHTYTPSSIWKEEREPKGCEDVSSVVSLSNTHEILHSPVNILSPQNRKGGKGVATVS